MSFNGQKAQIDQKEQEKPDFFNAAFGSLGPEYNSSSNKIAASETVDNSATQSSTTDATVTEGASPGPMSTSPVSPGQFIPGSTPPPWANELEPLATHNNILTLSVLTESEITDPLGTFRITGPEINILRSGGGANKPQTEVESFYGINTEFFINDLELDCNIIASTSKGNTNATSIKFSVLEPYSMGLFIETIRQAALKGGWENHIEAPYLLTMEFPGQDENNNSGIASYSKRMIPIKIVDIQFEVSAGGSVYSVEAVAWNDQSLADTAQKTQTDISIKGRTVSEILQSGLESLATILNNRELTKEETGQKEFADQYVFVFPKAGETGNTPRLAAEQEDSEAATETQATGVQDNQILYKSVQGSNAELEEGTEQYTNFETFKAGQLGKVKGRSKLGETIRSFAENENNINTIGQKLIIEEWIQRGIHPFGSEGLAYDSEKNIYNRGNTELTLSDDLRTFKFKMGTKVQDIIEEVILASTYAKELDEQLKNPPEDGKIRWFKIETECYVLQNNKSLNKTGKYPRIFVYRIVEFQAHINIFKAPNSSAHGVSQVKSECAKQYQYIYTGKNVDILDFEIRYDYAYNVPVLADKAQSSQRVVGSESIVQPASAPTTTVNDSEDSPPPAEGALKSEDIVSTGTGDRGGSSAETPETGVARMFNNTLLNSAVGMIDVDLTIMGDPFYISDSGLGNYNAGDTSYANMNRDGAMNYQNGEVYINLIFRTPVDYNVQDGTMLFPENTKIVQAFSGVFRVNTVKTSISNNQFIQTLHLNRMLGQEVSAPASLLDSGTEINSILGDLPGGVFDADRNIITTNLAAVQEAAAGLSGNFLSQTAAAATSKVRQLIGGLDPLVASSAEIAAAFGIAESLVPNNLNDLVNWTPPNIGNVLSSAIGVVNAIDPTQTLQGFANTAVSEAEQAARNELNKIGNRS